MIFFSPPVGLIIFLHFLFYSDENILVGSSQLVNSSNWTGELLYYFREKDIISDNDVISSSESKYLRYPLSLSVSAGTFLNTGTKVCILQLPQLMRFLPPYLTSFPFR